MWDTSRGLRESVVHGLAKVGLVWALAVLGTLFVVSAAYGSDPGAYAGAATSAARPLSIDAVGTAPRTIGLALALLVLAAGIAVLAIGAAPRLGGEHTTATPTELFDEPDPQAVVTELANASTTDRPLALSLVAPA